MRRRGLVGAPRRSSLVGFEIDFARSDRDTDAACACAGGLSPGKAAHATTPNRRSACRMDSSTRDSVAYFGRLAGDKQRTHPLSVVKDTHTAAVLDLTLVDGPGNLSLRHSRALRHVLRASVSAGSPLGVLPAHEVVSAALLPLQHPCSPLDGPLGEGGAEPRLRLLDHLG